MGGSEKLHSKLEEIKQARALTHDAAIVTAASLMTQSLAGQILHLNESIQRFDAKIEELFNHHPAISFSAVCPALERLCRGS